jgi:hypothetical protein
VKTSEKKWKKNITAGAIKAMILEVKRSNSRYCAIKKSNKPVDK